MVFMEEGYDQEALPDGQVLQRDCSTCQQVQVNTANACCYQVGDCLCIHYNGAMTNSIPPQISATCIHRR